MDDPLPALDDFPAWLAGELSRRRMSQRVLALRSGIDHSTISRVLSGERAPLLVTARALLKGLGYRLEVKR